MFLKIVAGMFDTAILIFDLKHMCPSMLQELHEHNHVNINDLFKSWCTDHCCVLKPEMTWISKSQLWAEYWIDESASFNHDDTGTCL